MDPNSNKQKKVFPYLMFIFALTMDFLEFISFSLLSFITTPLFLLSFWFWLLSRSAEARKKLLKKIKGRLFGGIIAESVPLISALPIKSVMVWTVYKGELRA